MPGEIFGCCSGAELLVPGAGLREAAGRPPGTQDGPTAETRWPRETTLPRLGSPGLNGVSNLQVPDESRIPFSAHTSALCQVPQNELSPSKLRNRPVIPEA